MILEMHDVHVSLGLSHVLQGVNLSIKPGETVGSVSYTHLRAHETG
jgi:Fe-S cluster assembly ATPase SufC